MVRGAAAARATMSTTLSEEAFTGKLHSYLLAVGSRIEELHTRVGKMDTRLVREAQEQAEEQAAATLALDERLTRRTQENTGSIQQISAIMTGVCAKLDEKFSSQIGGAPSAPAPPRPHNFQPPADPATAQSLTKSSPSVLQHTMRSWWSWVPPCARTTTARPMRSRLW